MAHTHLIIDPNIPNYFFYFNTSFVVVFLTKIPVRRNSNTIQSVLVN